MVGSGIQATELTDDVGVQLLANSPATVFGLGVLIVLFGPVSGAHFNPAVTLAVWFADRRTPGGPTPRDLAAYVSAQPAGAVAGAVLADAMFAEPLVRWSSHDRSAGHLLLGELVATAGLVLLALGLARTGRASFGPVAVASYIGAAYWFTSSTSFVNPAGTVGRAFTDTFAGIASALAGPFVAAQIAGTAVGLGLVAAVFGRLGGERGGGVGMDAADVTDVTGVANAEGVSEAAEVAGASGVSTASRGLGVPEAAEVAGASGVPRVSGGEPELTAP